MAVVTALVMQSKQQRLHRASRLCSNIPWCISRRILWPSQVAVLAMIQMALAPNSQPESAINETGMPVVYEDKLIAAGDESCSHQSMTITGDRVVGILAKPPVCRRCVELRPRTGPVGSGDCRWTRGGNTDNSTCFCRPLVAGGEFGGSLAPEYLFSANFRSRSCRTKSFSSTNPGRLLSNVGLYVRQGAISKTNRIHSLENYCFLVKI